MDAKNISKVHANSKSSSKAQHVYEIRDSFNNNSICKTGISCSVLKKDGNSLRAQSQVNKWNKEPGNEGRYTHNIVQKISPSNNARNKALKAEKQNADLNRQTLDPNRHQRP